MEELQSQFWLAGLALALAAYVFNTFPQRSEIDRIYTQLDRIEVALSELKRSEEPKPELTHKPDKPQRHR